MLVSSLSRKTIFTCATNVIKQLGIKFFGPGTLTLSFKTLAFAKYLFLDGIVLSCLKMQSLVNVAPSTVWKIIVLGFTRQLD